ncbi:MAG: NAD(P)-dependent oxidoreductase [Fibrella sp.]|nr:NAD(P)-dependent oxidoreductase [Armatimonadota bacterium]
MATADVLITGIGGFIAGNLARTLSGAGKKVVGIGRRPLSAEMLDAGVGFMPCDITDAEQIHTVVESVQPHTVYHLAAHSVLTGSTAAEMLRVNVSGTTNVLETCRVCGVPVCVAASSDKQYGALANPPYSDDDVTAFLNGGVYELSKAQGDQIARLFAGLYDAPSVRVARLVNIFGPGDLQWTRIVPGTIRRTVIGEAPRLTSGKAGEALREYLHVSDAVASLRLLAEDAAATGNQPYRTPEGKLSQVAVNVAGGMRLPAAGVIDTIRTVLRDDFGITGPEPVVQPGAVGVFEPGSQFNDAEKITTLFTQYGKVYSPRPLTDGLRETIPWYLDHLRTSGG